MAATPVTSRPHLLDTITNLLLKLCCATPLGGRR
jgi:hypothetical protein